MQTSLAQQLIVFSFSTSIFVLTLIGFIMCLSMMRLIRLQRLELAYMQANFVPLHQRRQIPQIAYSAPSHTPAYASRDTRPHRPKIILPASAEVDILITPTEITPTEADIPDKGYKPRSIPERKEKIS